MHFRRSVDAVRKAKSRTLLLFGILVICAEFYVLGPYSFVWIKDNRNQPSSCAEFGLRGHATRD